MIETMFAAMDINEAVVCPTCFYARPAAEWDCGEVWCETCEDWEDGKKCPVCGTYWDQYSPKMLYLPPRPPPKPHIGPHHVVVGHERDGRPIVHEFTCYQCL